MLRAKRYAQMDEKDKSDEQLLLPTQQNGKSPDKLARKKLTFYQAFQYCSIFIILDVAKQIVTYSIKYYNHGQYPLPQTHIVAWIEACKLIICLIIMAISTRGFRNFHLSPLFAIPALIYSVNNNLYFMALHYTTPPVWLMLIQSRVVLTALVYRFWFGKRLNLAQWVALVFLVLSLCLTQLNGGSVSPSLPVLQAKQEAAAANDLGRKLHQLLSNQTTAPAAPNYVTPMPPELVKGASLTFVAQKLSLVAIGLSLISASLSVIASIITEYFFKTDKRPFMEQQVQMYIFSSGLSFLFCFLESPTHASDGLQQTTNLVRVMLGLAILFGAGGGMAVAVVVKNLDNIVKIYSSALGNMGTAIISCILFPDRFNLDIYYVAALGVLFVGIYMYESKSFILCSCSRNSVPLSANANGVEIKKTGNGIGH